MANFTEVQTALIKSLKDRKHVAIGYHPDADGMTATAILIKYLTKTGITVDNIGLYPVDNIGRTFELEHLNDILEKKYDTIICTDYSVTKYEQLFYLSKKLSNIIYIDHHRYQPELEQIPYLYINSNQFPELTMPQLFTASKLMNSLLYNPSNDWLELVGLDGDVAIQSLQGSPISEASQRLNMLGLVKQQTLDLASLTERRNKLIHHLLDSETVFDFLDQFNADAKLSKLYKSILSDIDINIKALLELKETVLLDNNMIYVHEIMSPNKFEIAEHVLKAHIKHLKYNETFVIYSYYGQNITFRIYSSNLMIDCEQIARRFYGGGHRNRAGVTNMVLEDLPPKIFIEMVVERIKEMIGKNE
jgi:nanoRNase/pAp phosphatase (c-di-AMP/oligoRNAs hydrolase)